MAVISVAKEARAGSNEAQLETNPLVHLIAFEIRTELV